MMSMSRRACVTQITAVRLTNTTRNAPKVVRKIYRLMDPIRSIVPRSGNNRTPRAASPPDAKYFKLKSQPRQLYLDRPTKWPGNGKAVEHAQQNVNAGTGAGAEFRPAGPLVRCHNTPPIRPICPLSLGKWRIPWRLTFAASPGGRHYGAKQASALKKGIENR